MLGKGRPRLDYIARTALEQPCSVDIMNGRLSENHELQTVLDLAPYGNRFSHLVLARLEPGIELLQQFSNRARLAR